MQIFDSLKFLFHFDPHRSRRKCDTGEIHSCRLVCSVEHIDPPRSSSMLFDTLVYIWYPYGLQERQS